MSTAKELYQEIKSEDELPSGAGLYFKKLIDTNRLGNRELSIIADWLQDYLAMFPKRNKELLELIIQEQ